jgi:hypothetical protein
MGEALAPAIGVMFGSGNGKANAGAGAASTIGGPFAAELISASFGE